MTQLALDGTGTPTPPGLRITERQRWALELISEKEPLSTELLGAYLHELRAVGGGSTGHSHLDVCRFCKQEGRGMGDSLRKLDLVRYSSKAGGWRLATTEVRSLLKSLPAGPIDPATSEIPF